MSNIKAAINKALERIGHANGHAAPQSQDPIDKAAHEYMTTTIGESYFKKRREQAKKVLVDTLGVGATERLDAAVNGVEKSEIGDNVSLASGSAYNVDAQIKNGQSYLDTASLKNDLLKSMTTDEVNKLFEKHTKRRKPSVTYNVVEK